MYGENIVVLAGDPAGNSENKYDSKQSEKSICSTDSFRTEDWRGVLTPIQILVRNTNPLVLACGCRVLPGNLYFYLAL